MIEVLQYVTVVSAMVAVIFVSGSVYYARLSIKHTNDVIRYSEEANQHRELFMKEWKKLEIKLEKLREAYGTDS